jgi:hypothetical protein
MFTQLASRMPHTLSAAAATRRAVATSQDGKAVKKSAAYPEKAIATVAAVAVPEAISAQPTAPGSQCALGQASRK